MPGAEHAGEPEACTRPPPTPFVVGSLFVAGQKPPLAFFFAVNAPDSPLVLAPAFDGDVIVVEVEDEELVDEIDDEEFVRCTVFLCGINIRETSSELIEFKPPDGALEFHPSRGIAWKLGGDATAVVMGEGSRNFWVDDMTSAVNRSFSYSL